MTMATAVVPTAFEPTQATESTRVDPQTDRRGRLLRLGGIGALGAFTWAGQLKQVAPFNSFPIDFTLASAALSLIFAVGLIIRNRRLGLNRNAIKVWTLLLIIGLSGSFFRLTTEYGTTKEVALYQLTLPLALAAGVVVSNRDDFIALMISASSWGVFLSLSVLLTGVQDQTGRLNAATGATISFSRAAAVVLTAALAWALTERGRRMFWLMPVVLAVSLMEVFVIISIGSRGPIQAILIALLMMLALQAVRLQVKVSLRMGVVLGIGAVGMATLWSRTPEFSRRRILGIFTGDANARSGGGRDRFYQWTFENLPYTPFGRGWGAWPDESGFIGYNYPHNILLELWYEAGIVAFIAFLFVIYWVTRDQFRRVRTDRFGATLAIGMIYSWLGAAMVSGDFNDNRSLYLTLMAIAAVPLDKTPQPTITASDDKTNDVTPPADEIAAPPLLVRAPDWNDLWEQPKAPG